MPVKKKKKEETPSSGGDEARVFHPDQFEGGRAKNFTAPIMAAYFKDREHPETHEVEERLFIQVGPAVEEDIEQSEFEFSMKYSKHKSSVYARWFTTLDAEADVTVDSEKDLEGETFFWERRDIEFGDEIPTLEEFPFAIKHIPKK